MFKNKLVSVIMAVIMFAVFLPIAIPSAMAAGDPVKQNLTEAQRQELNDYFAQFVRTAFPLGDYDIADIPGSNDALIEYAVCHAIPLYPVDNYGNSYISVSSVNSLLLTCFSVESIQHRSVKTGVMPNGAAFGLTFENDIYHRLSGNGWYAQYPSVVEFYDNGNGTFSAKIKTANYGAGSGWGDDDLARMEQQINPPDLYYIDAIIQPYNDNGKNTYQLLYWKNRVNRYGALPVRQSTSSVEVTLTANPTASTVLVNGGNVAFDAYNIEGNNYVKLRDLAYVLNGTAKQFSIWYDESLRMIFLDKGYAYTPVGGEMASKGSGSKAATPTTARVFLDGSEVNLTAFNIDGNNYFKLRDTGQAFDFGVTWDGANNTIVIDTNKGYMPR